MVEPLRILRAPFSPDDALAHEWLVTNGLGGYASGTVAGAATRRYHGLLVAALPAPLGRVMMLNHLSEELRLPDGHRVCLGGIEHADRDDALPGLAELVEFRLEWGLPVWTWRFGPFLVEKRVWMTHRQNTTWVRYRLVEGDGDVRVRLHAAVHFRNHDASVSEPLDGPYEFRAVGDRYRLCAPDSLPALQLRLFGERRAFTLAEHELTHVLYRTEENRGYPAMGQLLSPGYLRVHLSPGHDATLVASTERAEEVDALCPDSAHDAELERRRRLVAVAGVGNDRFAGELTLAADQFIITPAGRVEDAARAHAAGDEVRTVIAGYHWFTDWGRDTMISLDGLTLCTGRALEAGYILRTFAHYVRDGLIPNYFPDGKNEGLYHTADATLWFFHAIDRYLAATGDQPTLKLLLPTLTSIIEHHLRGTRFGIGVDPKDGLLRQGADGYQLTWMDAKVDGWVVTPRRGKAVEINALWYNALRLVEKWLREAGDDKGAATMAGHAERAQASFNARFWCADKGWLYDVVDTEGGGDDASCRPNQLFAVSLPHPVLARSRWATVVEVVRDKLVTPVGLRSLAPSEPDYKPRYFGDLRSRDAAYHQGTVWSWLIGPFVDAWLRVHPDDRAGARRFLVGFDAHESQACVGSISEIFDGDPPFTPRGCIAQAWGVGELLRAWRKTNA